MRRSGVREPSLLLLPCAGPEVEHGAPQFQPRLLFFARQSAPLLHLRRCRGDPVPDPPPVSAQRGMDARTLAAIVRGMTEVTQILHALVGGDPSAASQLLPLVYDELRQLAAQKLALEKPGQTLQA